MPRTEQEAKNKGWIREKGCENGVNGNRYVLNGDRTVMLIFNKGGIIAGIAAAVDKNLPFNFPSKQIQPYFNDEGNSWTISAYFIDPKTVCSNSLPAIKQSTGDRLVFYSKQKTISVALKESAVDKFWTKGKCFWTMGQHYWVRLLYYISYKCYYKVFFKK